MTIDSAVLFRTLELGSSALSMMQTKSSNWLKKTTCLFSDAAP